MERQEKKEKSAEKLHRSLENSQTQINSNKVNRQLGKIQNRVEGNFIM